jgi:transposase
MELPITLSADCRTRQVGNFTSPKLRSVQSPLTDEKAAIVAESYAPGRTVCGVARRHGLTPAQLFTWRRLARRSRVPKAPALFVPAVVEPSSRPPLPPAPQPRRARRHGPVMGIVVEMDGTVVRIGSGASPQAIAAVIRALKVGP